MPSVVLFLTAILAFALSAICGGGASFIMLPVLSWLLPVAQTPAALSIGSASSSISRMAVFRRHIRWDIVLWFVPPALRAVWIGASLLSRLDPVVLEMFIGSFLLINVRFLFRPVALTVKPDTSAKWVLCLIGAATGFVSGLTGAVGLLFNRFYLTYGMSKEQIVATRAANELLLHIFKIALYFIFGLMSAKAAIMGGVISVAAIVSAWVMKGFLPKLSENLFRLIGYAAMGIAGTAMLVESGIALHKEQKLQLNVLKMDGGLETKIRWKATSFALEFEYDDGFEFERKISFEELPARLQSKANTLGKEKDRMLVEEVYGYHQYYYELYLISNGQLYKYDLR